MYASTAMFHLFTYRHSIAVWESKNNCVSSSQATTRWECNLQWLGMALWHWRGLEPITILTAQQSLPNCIWHSKTTPDLPYRRSHYDNKNRAISDNQPKQSMQSSASFAESSGHCLVVACDVLRRLTRPGHGTAIVFHLLDYCWSIIAATCCWWSYHHYEPRTLVQRYCSEQPSWTPQWIQCYQSWSS